MPLQKYFRAERAVVIALSPLLIVASCATATVGDGADSGTSTVDAGAGQTIDSSYGGDDQSTAEDAGDTTDADVTHVDAAVKPPITRDGLVGEWLFTDNLNDTSGNSYDGTATGATFGVDRFGTANAAAVFNGVDQYISMPDEPDFYLTGDLTVSAWIDPASLTELAGIVSKCQSSSCSAFTFRLGFSSDIDIDSNTNGISVPSQLTTSSWQHVAAVMSGGVGTVYVNGVQTYSHTQGFTPQATGNTLRVGVDYQHSFFSGSIDDVRIYTRALTATEIAALAADK